MIQLIDETKRRAEYLGAAVNKYNLDRFLLVAYDRLEYKLVREGDNCFRLLRTGVNVLQTDTYKGTLLEVLRQFLDNDYDIYVTEDKVVND